MYATVEDNKIHISVAEYYSAQWYDKHWPMSRHDKFEFEYGSLEIDVHRDDRKFLTGFVVDPRKFIVDYLKMRHRKNFAAPKRVVSVSIEADEHVELFTVKFLKSRAFVIDGVEKDLILPEFSRRHGKLAVQGFEALDTYKGPTEIVSAEIKTETLQLVTAFGQACAYKLFSHKVYLVVPRQSHDEEISRLDSLCQIFGIGLVTFNVDSPSTPDFRILVRLARHEPDLFYTNKYMARIEKELFS